MTPRRIHTSWWLLVLLPGCLPAAPLTIAQAWQAARLHDPTFAVAEAQLDADRSKAAQARSLWLPSLAAIGSSGRATAETLASGAAFAAPGFGTATGVDFRTSITGGTATRWALAAEQPLFSADRLAQSRELRNAARIGELNFRIAEQQLMLKTVRTCFDLIMADRTLQALQRQAEAAARARTEAAERYRAGDIAVTDLREAEAIADQLDFLLLEARNRATLARSALADVTGVADPEMARSPIAAPADDADLPSLESWLMSVRQGNHELAVQALRRSNAAAARARYALPFAPALSIAGQVGRETLRGTGDFGDARATNRQAAISLQVSMPLFTGGWRNAMQRETWALDRRADAELEDTTLRTLQAARAAWLNAATSSARVAAAQRAEASAAARLAATRVGQQAGARTTLELLTAEGAALQATTERIQAQLEQHLTRLTLLATSGELTAAQLDSIDQFLH